MFKTTMTKSFAALFTVILLASVVNADITAYSNFASDNGGWGYNTNYFYWSVYYDGQHAMQFKSSTSGYLTNIWVAIDYYQYATSPDTIIVKFTKDTGSNEPTGDNILETWTATNLGVYGQWNQPIQLTSVECPLLNADSSYFIWAAGTTDSYTWWGLNTVDSTNGIGEYSNTTWTYTANNGAGGAFRVDVSTTGGIEFDDNAIPDGYQLVQNYPNPFNPTTTISYTIPRQTKVTIEIFDLLGRLVDSINPGAQQAGNHQITWNAGDQPSGVYFYKITAGDYSDAKKMTLLK